MGEDNHLPSSEPETEGIAAQDAVDPGLTPDAASTQTSAEGEVGKASVRPRRRQGRRRADLRGIQPGQQYEGQVVGVTEFGAFVDVGLGRDGLIHISELKEGFVDKVDKVVSVEDKVTVWVKSIDEKRNRIALTMINPSQQSLSLRELESGMVLKGKVEDVARFGVFVDIGAPVNGLVHISEMAEGYVRSPQSIVSPGDEVDVVVLDVDPRRRKISLSMKGVDGPDLPSEDEAEPAMTAMQFAWQQALAAKEDGDAPSDAGSGQQVL